MPNPKKIDAEREALRARVQRDIAASHAAEARLEKKIAAAQRDSAISDNIALANKARDAEIWGALNAVEKKRAQRDAQSARQEANFATTALLVLAGVVVIVGIAFLAWRLNRAPEGVSTTTTVVTPAPRINSTSVAAPAQVPVPIAPPISSAAPPPLVSMPAQPARSAPTSNTTVIVGGQPPAPSAQSAPPTPTIGSPPSQNSTPASSQSAPDMGLPGANGTAPGAGTAGQ
jgi:hypothetical protein